ncbi:MAG: PLP-dependent aminotransferase family protein [Candidatus Obscuribacterales bacterium]
MNLSILNELQNARVTAEGIHGAIETAIAKGGLKPGDKLASTRDIALYLGVSRTTVVKAFETLTSQGFIKCSQGAGTWVSETKASSTTSNEKNESYPWHERFNGLAHSLSTLSAETVEASDFDEMNFGSAPLDLVPVKQWRTILQKASDNIKEGGFKDNQEVFGYRPLREAIAGFLRRSKGIVCEPEQVVLGSGVQSVISPAFLLLARPGDLIVCENPGFYGAREQFLSLGADVETVGVDEDGLKVDELEKLPRPPQWLYVAPSCQEPTGVTLSLERRNRLLSICQSWKTAILEDDWDSEFHYGQNAAPSLFSLDTSGSVIYFYSFWRLLYPLVSVSFLVIPKGLIEVFQSYKNVWDRQFTLVEHHALTEMINEGHVENHIRRTWKRYRKRRQSLIFSLKSRLRENIEIVSSSTGMHVLARFNGSHTAARIEHCARQAGLTIAGTAPFYAHSPRPNEFMIRFTDIPEDELDGRALAFSEALAGDLHRST